LQLNEDKYRHLPVDKHEPRCEYYVNDDQLNTSRKPKHNIWSMDIIVHHNETNHHGSNIQIFNIKQTNTANIRPTNSVFATLHSPSVLHVANLLSIIMPFQH